jgi:hypothetical protein
MTKIVWRVYAYLLNCLGCLKPEDQVRIELSRPISPIAEPLRIKIPVERVENWQEDPLYRGGRPSHI